MMLRGEMIYQVQEAYDLLNGVYQEVPEGHPLLHEMRANLDNLLVTVDRLKNANSYFKMQIP